MLSPDARIVMLLAERAGGGVCRRVIRQLQALPSEMTHGVLPHLRTVWDEVCIQKQGAESVFWDAYVEQMELFVHHEIAKLPTLEREALWLQTDAGRDWEFDDERRSNEPPVYMGDIVLTVRAQLLSQAAGWSNPAIRAQQDADGRCWLDDGQ
jgi:hypothetical protein